MTNDDNADRGQGGCAANASSRPAGADAAAKPRLDYFRATPLDLTERPPLASSLQNLEQCFLLIAMGGFPGALVSCALAWECAMRAWLRVPAGEDVKSWVLLARARDCSRGLRLFSEEKLTQFREARNRIVHEGYSPRDDEECARLLLETGWPFLKACYRELFDFHLDWRDIGSGAAKFSELTPAEQAKAGLEVELAEQLHVVTETHARAREFSGSQPSLSFRAFQHLLRWHIKRVSLTTAEDEILRKAEEHGVRFEAEMKQKERVRDAISGETWEFDCPICHGCGSVVGELDEAALSSGMVRLRSCCCVGCHLVVPRGAVCLANLFLRESIEAEKDKILKDFGIP